MTDSRGSESKEGVGRLRELTKKLNPGPYEIYEPNPDEDYQVRGKYDYCLADYLKKEEAEFIALAANHMSKLLDVVDAVQAWKAFDWDHQYEPPESSADIDKICAEAQRLRLALIAALHSLSQEAE